MAARDAEVVVVGAGLAGLNAARLLQRRGHEPLVLERDEAPGGRVRTVEWAGAIIELGAAYFTSDYARFKRLLEDLGLADAAMPFPNAFRTEILRGDDWHFVDYQRPETLVRFGAIGWADKLSAAVLGGRARYLHRRALRHFDVASAADMDGSRGYSSDALRYMAAPTFEAFCGYRADEVSVPLQALTARFNGKPHTLDGGLGRLPAELARDLDVRYGAEVVSVAEQAGGVRVETADGEAIAARACVVATPGDVAARLVERDYLQTIRYTRYDELLVRTARPAERPRGLYMRLIPPGERAGALHSIVYLDHLVPDGGLLLAGPRPGSTDAAEHDDAFADHVGRELQQLHPEIEIVDRRPLRQERLVPTFEPGRAPRLREFRASLRPGPIDLAGDYLYGPTMESALMSAEDAVGRIARFLSGA